MDEYNDITETNDETQGEKKSGGFFIFKDL